MATEQLKRQLLDRCETDLIQFSEVEYVARDVIGIRSRPERRKIIVDAIMELVAEGRVEVGDAVDIGGFVDFRAWPDRGSDLRRRLSTATDGIARPELGEGFWLAKPLAEA